MVYSSLAVIDVYWMFALHLGIGWGISGNRWPSVLAFREMFGLRAVVCLHVLFKCDVAQKVFLSLNSAWFGALCHS